MGISTVRKCVVLMLIFILVVTQLESITSSQEFASIKQTEPPCDARCRIICSIQKEK
jgi:hypothetical protein